MPGFYDAAFYAPTFYATVGSPFYNQNYYDAVFYLVGFQPLPPGVVQTLLTCTEAIRIQDCGSTECS